MTISSQSTERLQTVIDTLSETRRRTLALVEGISEADLVRVHSPLMSPLAWDLGHIAAFEDLWLVHRHGDRPLLREELAAVYDAFETPRAGRGGLPFLRPSEALDYLRQVHKRAIDVLRERGVGDGSTLELSIRHEMQHGETMLQTMQLARLGGHELPGEAGGSRPLAAAVPAPGGAQAGVATGLELVEVPGGPCTIGAGAGGFAYDNERPRHGVHVRDLLIGRTPVTNADYLEFVRDGGYRRREWWSDDGWAWKERHGIARPGGWTADDAAEWRLSERAPLDPRRPVVHVSWFEAEAFARAHGARLPTEAEWEKAATWDRERGAARAFPWGDRPPVPGVHANLDHRERGPVAVDGHPAGASPYGCLGMIGDVWEWTASHFVGYPGFVAEPYREYSEAFFGSEHRVLRGGSWATRARLITPAFRNWDLPQRRQIFAGFRIARDA